MVRDEVERQRLTGVIEGLVDPVQTFGLYPKGDESLKDLKGVRCGGVVRTELNDVHKGLA